MMQPDFETGEYSSSNELAEEEFRAAMKDTEALLSDLEMSFDSEAESAQKLIAALAAADEEAIATAADAASSGLPVVTLDWLTKFRELEHPTIELNQT